MGHCVLRLNHEVLQIWEAFIDRVQILRFQDRCVQVKFLRAEHTDVARRIKEGTIVPNLPRQRHLGDGLALDADLPVDHLLGVLFVDLFIILLDPVVDDLKHSVNLI